jgi:hypothetical protein
MFDPAANLDNIRPEELPYGDRLRSSALLIISIEAEPLALSFTRLTSLAS